MTPNKFEEEKKKGMKKINKKLNLNKLTGKEFLANYHNYVRKSILKEMKNILKKWILPTLKNEKPK